MSRLIDADELLKSIIQMSTDGNVFDKIRNAPTIEPQKWIPASERLPGVETDVLLQFSKNMCVGFLNQDNDWRIYSGGSWFTDILEGDMQPTAWMPLPEPWKGGKG